jgi:hypothetical protein
MSAQDLVKDPLKYCKAHTIQFSHQAGDVNGAASGMQELDRVMRQGWSSVYFGMTPGKFTDFGFFGDTKYNDQTGAYDHVRIGKSNIHSIVCKTSATDKGVRFLPWEPNAVTSMSLDANARSFFTGPLSGCSIFVVEDIPTGVLWCFHANRNNDTGAGNTGMKHAMMATAARTDRHLTGRVRYQCIYGRDYNDLGFVFGVKSKSAWKFYSADTGDANPGGAVRYQTIIRELPRS